MAEKEAIVVSEDFEMDWDALQRDKDLLGDWPNTIKPRDSADPTWKVPPDERGQKVLIKFAKKMGRQSESLRGVRSWLLDNKPE